jgi:hypothetical protein
MGVLNEAMKQAFLSSFSFFYCCKQHALTYYENKGGVSHIVALPFTFKNILRQKKNYGNSNKYSTMQRYNLYKKTL